MKKTVVFGASPNPSRYSYIATVRLNEFGHEVIPLGIRKGSIEGQSIIEDWPIEISDLDTVTMYVGADKQPTHYQYILDDLKPKRIIFNPGAENAELSRLATEKGVEVENACTLVMLATGQY